MNESKTEITLDFKIKENRKWFLEDVIPKVDILIESYRPGTMEKLGLGQ